MRNGAADILSWILFGGLCWVVFKFYWLRVMACASGLALWGAGTIAAPIYLVSRYARDGHTMLAIVTLVVCALPALFWFIAASAGFNWLKIESRDGRLWQRWNAV
jgi:hypothetical protein